jgi:hypothetical protein
VFREKASLDFLRQFHFLLGGEQGVAARPAKVVPDGVVRDPAAGCQ